MSVNEQEFKMMIEELVENEKTAVKLLDDSMKRTSNTVIRLLLHQLALDSTKHERMLSVILELLEAPSKEQFESEGEKFRKVIEKHVEVEREMLEDFEKIVDKTEDKRVRFILQNIVSDEKRHHAIMKRVYELVCEGDEAKDEKWWDFLFRYSRLSG